MSLGVTEILLIAAVFVVFFGASRIPKLARSVREARDELRASDEGSAGHTDR